LFAFGITDVPDEPDLFDRSRQNAKCHSISLHSIVFVKNQKTRFAEWRLHFHGAIR
jgi:hypothetical protein